MWSLSIFFVCATLFAVVAQQLVSAEATLSSLTTTQELSGMVMFKNAAEAHVTRMASRPPSGLLASADFFTASSGLAAGADDSRWSAYWEKIGSDGEGWLYVFPKDGGTAASDFGSAMSALSGRSLLIGSVVSTGAASKAIDAGSSIGKMSLPSGMPSLKDSTSIWAVPIAPPQPG